MKRKKERKWRERGERKRKKNDRDKQNEKKERKKERKKSKREKSSLCEVMVNVLDCGFESSDFELLSRSLSDKYPWERIESPCLPDYRLNSNHYSSSTRMALALNNPRRLMCHQTEEQNPIKKVWFGLLGLWHINLCRLFNAKSIFM